jgi:hypothetical protein
MDHPVGDMVVLDQVEYLGLIDVPGISAGVDDPVGVP